MFHFSPFSMYMDQVGGHLREIKNGDMMVSFRLF